MTRRAPVWIIVLGLLTQSHTVSAQAPRDALTLISEDDRESIPTIREGSRVLVALDDLVRIFDLEQRGRSSDGTVTVSRDNQTIILTADQQLASVGGQLVDLRSPPKIVDGRWLVPIDFLNRALSRVLDDRLTLRRQAQLVLIATSRCRG